MFIKLENGVPVGEPISFSELRQQFPNVSFSPDATAAALEPFGYMPFESPQPTVPKYHTWAKGALAIQGGKVVQTWVYPEQSLQTAKTEALAELARIRFAHETKGITLPNGARIHTDRDSQALISGAFSTLKEGMLPSINWKARDGVWVTLTISEITPIATLVCLHVEACFTNEKRLSEMVLAANSINELSTIDLQSGWPQ